MGRSKLKDQFEGQNGDQVTVNSLRPPLHPSPMLRLLLVLETGLCLPLIWGWSPIHPALQQGGLS